MANESVSLDNIGLHNPAPGAPSWRWIVGWALLTTFAFPIALFAATPIAAALLGLIDLGVKAGLWASYKGGF
jgi:hypothetical protein